MSLTPFDLDFGTTQGRIAPTGWVPPSGDYAFCLGSDIAGAVYRLAADDYIEVSQGSEDFAGVTFLRTKVRLRGPSSMPATTSWRLGLYLDGVELTGREIPVGRTRDLVDIAGDIADLAVGPHEIAFRLTLLGDAGNYDVELPGVYIDAVVLDTSDKTPALINRDPEPLELAVPLNSLVAFEIADYTGTGIDLAATDVYVNDELVISGGAFEAGWDGASSATSTPQAGVLRVVIEPETPFAPLTAITLRIVTAVDGGGPSIDTTYTFTTEDTIAPVVVSAQAIGQQTVRVTFDEPVLQVSTSGESDALNHELYTFELITGAPAVPIEAVSVAAVNGTTIDITIDWEMTPGATYSLIVSAVADLVGNAVTPPLNVASFAGYQRPIPEGRSFQLLDMLPRMNIEEDASGDLRKFILCFQEVVDLMLGTIDDWTNILDFEIADEKWVDLMLEGMGNPFPFDLTLDDKRRLLRSLVSIYRKKGTRPGIIAAIRFFLGIETDVIYPAYEGLGLGDAEIGDSFILGSSFLHDRFSFKVVSPISLSSAQNEQMAYLATYMKASREHLLGIDEPAAPPAEPDHLELGYSDLGVNWILH